MLSLLKEKRVFEPSSEFKENSNTKEYVETYKKSIEDPEAFWASQSEKYLIWDKQWDTVLTHDWSSIGDKEGPYVSFFNGGTLNVSHNCLDRHLNTATKDKTAIIWRGETKGEKKEITYQELHKEVCKAADALTELGITAGDRVTLFMPMIPELTISMLACARIGAIHSVVFSAFSSEALASRIEDCKSSLIITSDVSFHSGRTLNIKEKVDTALSSTAHDCSSVKKVIILKRTGQDLKLTEGRDILWSELITNRSIDTNKTVNSFPAEQPLFILYTSGSTGKPKGVMHTSAGYLLYAAMTSQIVFDFKDKDIYWCTADIGWITGHSYVVYGPLLNGVTTVMFEGNPTYPDGSKCWEIIEDLKVNTFYTAPTLIRSLMKLGEEIPNKYDLSSLRLLGSVGEPINPEAWMWYYEVIGKTKCPVVDTWWQTETGGIMITTIPGVHATKPGSAGLPMFGISPKILDKDGHEVGIDEGGSLVIDKPWPGMIRGVYGDLKNELIKNVYFSAYSGKYFSSDGARKDSDAYYWLLGRIDDVINVSAHRLSTAEIESALVSHPSVAEAAVVGVPHDVKGQGIYCFVTLKNGVKHRETDGAAGSKEIAAELILQIRTEIGPIAAPEAIHFASGLPKTRSGKIMRRILRKIAEGDTSSLGDTSTLADESIIEELLGSSPYRNK